MGANGLCIPSHNHKMQAGNQLLEKKAHFFMCVMLCLCVISVCFLIQLALCFASEIHGFLADLLFDEKSSNRIKLTLGKICDYAEGGCFNESYKNY